MVHPPYHPSEAEGAVMAAFVLATLAALLLSSLFFQFRRYRYWLSHPDPETDRPLRRAKGRCAVLTVLFLLVLTAGVWRFLPLSLQNAANLEPESLSVRYTTAVAEGGHAAPVQLETGVLSREEAAPLLETLEQILLRRDFRNLLPLSPAVDQRLLGGRQAELTLRDADGSQQLLILHGAQLLTLNTGSQHLCYHLYEPDYAERLFTQLERWQERPLTEEELACANDRFAPTETSGSVNPLCGLTASRYASPEALDLGAFLRQLPGTPADREDLEEIRRLGGRLDEGRTWMRYSPLTISGQLELRTGLWLDQLENLGDALYSPRLDCYYMGLDGSVPESLFFTSGSIFRDQATLVSDSAVVTLRWADDRWLVQACLDR